MEKFLIVLIFSFSTFANSQILESEEVLKLLSEESCQCIDSIDLYNRGRNQIVEEINKCIDSKVISYQILTKIKQSLPTVDSVVALGKEVQLKPKDGQEKIEINVNEHSQDYKDAYFSLERYLMKNCQPLIIAINSNEKQSEFSVSKNNDAIHEYTIGQDEMKNENFDKAIQHFKNAVKLDDKFAFAWDNLGLTYRYMGNYDEAIKAYQKSLTIDPYGEFPLTNIAIAYAYKKDFSKAIGAYEKLGIAYPGNPEVFYGLGQIYAYDLKELENALNAYCKAYEIYLEQKSPFRSDAEQAINYLYNQFKENDKEDIFFEILKKYKL